VVSADGTRALAVCWRPRSRTIVLLDLMLPEGRRPFELCRQIRRAVQRGDHRGVGPRRGAGQGDRAQRWRRRLHDQAVQHRGTAGPDHRHACAAPGPARPRPNRGRRLSPRGTSRSDLASQQVTRDGQPVHLTPTEFALLRELATNRGKLLTHAQPAAARVGGTGTRPRPSTWRVYVRRLRAKLGSRRKAPRSSSPSRGAGYRFAPE